MRQEGLDREILSLLSLHDRVDLGHEDRARDRWKNYVRKMQAPKSRHIRIGVTGKYAALRDAYASIMKAVEHCSTHLQCEAEIDWVNTPEVTEDNVAAKLADVDAVIVPGGFGLRGVEGKIACVRYCREGGVPYLGICLGFQVAVIEFARNVMGLKEANSTEFDSQARDQVISELPDQKKVEQLGGSMRLGGQDVVLTPGSLAWMLYGKKDTIRERFRHRYEVDPTYIERLEAAGLVFSGKHPKYPIMQMLELATGEGDGEGGAGTSPAPDPSAGVPTRERPTHPFFVAAQFHPELTGRPLRPQAMFVGLISAAIRRKYPDAEVPTYASIEEGA
jgi:CTP synthase